MEIAFRAALVAWLAASPALADRLNSVSEEAPSRTSLPWLAIATSASADWSTKTTRGREVRVALELHHRGDDSAGCAETIRLVEDRIAALPARQDGFFLVTSRFLRARAEQRGESRRAVLIEYAFRLLAD